MSGDLHEWPAVPLAAICRGAPVVDACGAFVGQVESVLLRSGFVKVCCAPGDQAFLVAAGQIAYVADDHVRLSVTADQTRIVDAE